MSREDIKSNFNKVINNFINVQESPEPNKHHNIKADVKRALSIRNIINVLHLTPFSVLKAFWSDISLNSHKYRNENQAFREPDTLEKMRLLEDIGLFKLLGKTGPTKGHTGAHNIPPDEGGLFGRWNNFLTLDGHGENLDYRGIPGSCFDGVQCIYNENTGKLVTKDLNKGTFDYCHPSKNNFNHFIYDVLPWVVWSNCGDDTIRKQNIPRETWKLIENTWNNYSKGEISKEDAQAQVTSIIEERHPLKKRVKLTFNENDRPDFDTLEEEEIKSSESYFVLSLAENITLRMPTKSTNVNELLQLCKL
jgi:hypothetical protein